MKIDVMKINYILVHYHSLIASHSPHSSLIITVHHSYTCWTHIRTTGSLQHHVQATGDISIVLP